MSTHFSYPWTSLSHNFISHSQSLIGASLVVQTAKNLPAMQETRVWSLSQEGPLEKGMTTHSSILAWRMPWTEEPGGLAKSQTQLSNEHFQSLMSSHFQKIKILKQSNSKISIYHPILNISPIPQFLWEGWRPLQNPSLLFSCFPSPPPQDASVFFRVRVAGVRGQEHKGSCSIDAARVWWW